MQRILGLILTASLALALLAPMAVAAEKLVLDPAAAGADPAVRVLAERGETLVLELTLPSLTMEELEVAGLRYQALSIPGGTYRGEAGQAGLPSLSRLVQVPLGAAVTARVVAEDRRSFAGYRLLPIQPDEATAFVSDRDYYARDAQDARPLVEIGAPAILRDLRVVPIHFNPVSYNPARGTLEVARRVELELDFSQADPSAERPVAHARIPESFARMYEDVVVNYRPDEAETGPGTYLVICPNNTTVVNTLEPLLQWRREQGYAVELATTAQTGTSTTNIKNYIQGRYNTADPPLEFVVLVGDANGSVAIPCWYESLSGQGGEGDHYYTTLAGSDILADVHIGRISVTSTTQLGTAIDKIVTYEKNPPTSDSGWFNRAGLIGDPSTSGETCVYINQWLKQHLLAHGYAQVDTAWGGSFTSFFMNTMNQGISVFGYRGYWHMSGITASYIDGTTNGYELPFAVIITCDTGSFSDDTTCNSEAFLRSTTGGGIGGIGLATIGTHTRENNVYYQGCWQGAINGSDHRLGVAHTRGKLQMYIDFYGHSNNTAEIWAMWANLMGDPATDLWMAYPTSFSVAAPATVPVGASSAPVTVRAGGAACEGALVTLYKEGELQVSGYTDYTGLANLPLSGVTGGALTVTVTKHNHMPWQGTVTLGSTAVYLTCHEVTVDDDISGGSQGNGDHVANPGETLELPMSLRNLGSSSATGVTATLTSSDPYVTITDGVESFGDIGPGSSAWSAEDFDVVVSPRAPDGHVIGLNVEATTGIPTWTSLASLAVVSAAFDYESFTWSGGGGTLDPGESGTFSVEVRNNGSLAGASVTATLDCENPWVTVTDASGSYGTIGVGAAAENTSNAFGLAISPECFAGNLAWFTLTLSFNGLAEDEVVFALPIGTASSDDPIGPDGYGYYCFDNTDTAYPYAPTYAWVEIDPNYGGAGTDVGLSDFGFEQDDTRIVDLPFVFTYYGQAWDQISICSNGWIAMGTTDQTGCWNYNIPSTSGADNLIAPFWDDLKQSGTNRVYRWHDVENHRYVVQWSRMTNASGGSQNVEVVLHDPAYWPTPTGDGEIVFQYHTVNDNDGTRRSSVGIQNQDRTDGIGYLYWSTYTPGAATLTSGRALRFLPIGSMALGTIAGDVTNASAGGIPAPGVSIHLVETGLFLVSAADGHYEGSVGEGTYTVRAEHESFAPVTVPGVEIVEGETTVVDFALTDIAGPAIAGTTVLPSTSDTAGPYVVEATITDFSGVVDATLWYTVFGGGPYAVPLTLIDAPSGLYRAEIPGQPLNANVHYWLTAADGIGLTSRDPEGTGSYDFWVLNAVTIFEDDMETDQGWTVGDVDDDASTGIWVRVDPIGVTEGATVVQPEDDASPSGTLCYITGNNETGSQGADDVDNGKTTLLSPVFDLSEAMEVTLSYRRWYCNDTGNAPNEDTWLVQVTNNGSTWVNLESTLASDHSWALKTFLLDEYIALTDQVRLRFIASDYGSGSVVEAGVDEFTLSGYQVPDLTAVGDGAPPAVVTLLGNAPNPFNPTTAIRFGLPSRQPVTLRVYDASGRLVRTLARDAVFAAGYHAVSWDGRDEAGQPASSGLYFYALDAGGERLTGKAVLLK